MARLVNKTTPRGARHKDYGTFHKLDKPISLIGTSRNCDIIINQNGSNLGISREHAYVINYKNDFYLGDLSQEGTFWAIKKYLKHYEPIRVFNSLESPLFKKFLETEKSYYLEKELSASLGEEFDESTFKRYYFFKSFLKDPKNLRELIEMENRLALLSHKDKFIIPPWFAFEFQNSFFRN